jgi:hypothetical protein
MKPVRLALCETMHAGPLASNHVRQLGPEGLKLGGGIPGAALCGRDLAKGWDLRETTAEEVSRLAKSINDAGRPWVCRACAAKVAALRGDQS